MLELESDDTFDEIFFRRDSREEAKESEGKEITSGSGSRVRSRELYERKDSVVDCLIGISFFGGRGGCLGVILCFMRGIAFLITSLADEGASISELSLLIMGE